MQAAQIGFELIVVDDGSSDGTLVRLKELQPDRPWLRVLHRPAPRGQSAAMYAGIQAARGACIATLDADLQNDPADLPGMLAKIEGGEADMVQGDRSANRNDHAIRKIGSVIGRKSRLLVLGDPARDTGCSARVVRAEIAKQFPLQFKGMHRFMPAYARMLGARVVEVRVNHHARHSGTTKYGLGLLSRGPAGLIDLLAVRWMTRRYRDSSTDSSGIDGDRGDA
jgi:glycosyltransferase involved in cell wall biosynthesis